MQHGEPFRGQRVGVIVSGGNVDPQTLQEILREAALR
jgi:threonine dehydratase